MKKETISIESSKQVRNHVQEQLVKVRRRSVIIPAKKGKGSRYDRGQEKRKASSAISETISMGELVF